MNLIISAFVFGLSGSLHCVGMCGGFSAALSMGRPDYKTGLWFYQAGRLTTYAALGTFAALTGFGLMLAGGIFPRALAVLAGLAMILMGLNLAGLSGDPLSALTSAFIRRMLSGKKISGFLTAGKISGWFLAGLANGLLPCGLVYAALFLSLSATDPVSSVLVMLAFGAGTVPAMISAPFLMRKLAPAFRLNMVRLSAIILILMGAWTVYRGFSNPHHIHNRHIMETPGAHHPMQDNCLDETAP